MSAPRNPPRRQERLSQKELLSRRKSAEKKPPAATRTRSRSKTTSKERTREEGRELRATLRRLWNLGFEILPIEPGGKVPMGGYSSRNTFGSARKMDEFLDAYPQANFAVATGPGTGVFVLDIDGEEGVESYRRLTAEHGKLPWAPSVKTPRGYHLWLKYPSSEIGCSTSRIAPKIDVRGEGGYALLPGSIGANGARYRFRPGHSLDDVAIAAAPPWLIELASNPRQESTSRSVVQTQRAERPRDIPSRYGAVALESESAKVRSLPDGCRNDGLNRAAFRMGQLAGAGAVDESAARAELRTAALATGLPDSEVNATIESGISAGQSYPRVVEARRSGGPDAEIAAQPDPLAEELAKLGARDIDNADRLYARHRGKLMYTPGGGWFVYGGRSWKRDEGGEVRTCAIDVARRIKSEAAFKPGEEERQATLRHAARSGSRSGIDAMVHLVQPKFLVNDSELDRDKYLLSVENGTLDLRTGELRPHDPQDRITKLASIAYDPEARCPTFLRFLNDVTESDREVMRFIWRVFGYCLTGRTDEQAFFFIIGPGRTGKSVLGNVLRELLGDYGLQADMKSFLIKKYENAIPTDIARLRGARVVVASEANVNKQIDEALIKAMTGGDPLVARFMRQNEFQFTPEFKLVLVANDFPRVRRKDDAFWRRARVIPMYRVVPESEVDPGLQEKLRRELPGILAWAVKGCLS
jgi:putative DNA primase/helicase